MIVEIDVTHSSLDTLSIFAAVGAPEVWHHDGERLRILALVGERYEERAENVAFLALQRVHMTTLTLGGQSTDATDMPGYGMRGHGRSSVPDVCLGERLVVPTGLTPAADVARHYTHPPAPLV